MKTNRVKRKWKMHGRKAGKQNSRCLEEKLSSNGILINTSTQPLTNLMKDKPSFIIQCRNSNKKAVQISD
jgi:hypothetical protein